MPQLWGGCTPAWLQGRFYPQSIDLSCSKLKVMSLYGREKLSFKALAHISKHPIVCIFSSFLRDP